VDASRDKPERRALSVLSLRLPRSRAFAGWSMKEESTFRYWGLDLQSIVRLSSVKLVSNSNHIIILVHTSQNHFQ